MAQLNAYQIITILRLKMNGMSLRHIANMLDISPATVHYTFYKYYEHLQAWYKAKGRLPQHTDWIDGNFNPEPFTGAHHDRYLKLS